MRPSRLAVTIAICFLAACGGKSGGTSTTPPPPPPPATDPCSGVSLDGRCDNATTVAVCVVPTGNAPPAPQTYACAGGQSCQVTNGKAGCVLNAGACVAGNSECTTATTIRSCSTAGAWDAATTCANGCESSALGAFCLPADATTPLSGKFQYSWKQANSNASDWEAKPGYVGGSGGFLVLSGYTVGNTTTFLGATYTADGDATTAGDYSVLVRATPVTGQDFVTFVAAHDDGAGNLAYLVADPNFNDSADTSHPAMTTGTKPGVWGWSWAVKPTTGPLFDGAATVPLELSGPANVYNWLHQVAKENQARYGRLPLSLIAWVGYHAEWSCGACFADRPTNAFGAIFQSQMVIGGTARDEAFWSDAVITHESGHWLMASYGKSPGEGGSHMIAHATMPGMAWSEGWATFNSGATRKDTLYVDKQGGSMFSIDFGTRDYFGQGTWNRPTPAGGLLQRMDENEVAAQLISLAVANGDAAPLYAAMAAPRAVLPPYKRGYTRHTWTMLNTGDLSNVVDTGQAKPCLADYFDALLCGSVSFPPATFETAIVPATYFPFPASGKLCQ
jgi:hypothetical protein